MVVSLCRLHLFCFLFPSSPHCFCPKSYIRTFERRKSKTTGTFPKVRIRVLCHQKRAVKVSERGNTLFNLSKRIFPSNAKLASIKPIYKKGSRLDVSNYRPISVISAFSKVIEKHFESSMVDYINSILSQYLSGFRKGYSCQISCYVLQKNGENI